MESGLTQKEKPKESQQESQSKSSDLLEFVEALGEESENSRLLILNNFFCPINLPLYFFLQSIKSTSSMVYVNNFFFNM